MIDMQLELVTIDCQVCSISCMLDESSATPWKEWRLHA